MDSRSRRRRQLQPVEALLLSLPSCLDPPPPHNQEILPQIEGVVRDLERFPTRREQRGRDTKSEWENAASEEAALRVLQRWRRQSRRLENFRDVEWTSMNLKTMPMDWLFC